MTAIGFVEEIFETFNAPFLVFCFGLVNIVRLALANTAGRLLDEGILCLDS